MVMTPAHSITSLNSEGSQKSADVIVIGAGIVGAMCAYFSIKAGLRTLVIDRSTVASGTTGAGEGNIMVSDKSPGPELELALISRDLWFEVGNDVGDSFELVAKGGIAIARHDPTSLFDFAKSQREAGVDCRVIDRSELYEREPFINRSIEHAVYYPQDGQCQPMLAAANILRHARTAGAQLIPHSDVLRIEKSKSSTGSLLKVHTTSGEYVAPYVINASGTWAGEIAERAGSSLPIMPRKGFILVTAPLPPKIFHKVYDSDYVDNVASSEADLQTSTVVEGTKSGTILIGASRQRVGYNKNIDVSVIKKLAQQATSLYPFLADTQLLRVYNGFRPYSPDHLPVIGEDFHVPGLYHCAGHEGAGIGLSAASGKLISQLITGSAPLVDPTPFSPHRFQMSLAQ